MEKVYPDVAVRYELARTLAEFVTREDADLERGDFLRNIIARVRRSLVETISNGVRIRPMVQPFWGGRDGTLAETVTIAQIKQQLGAGIERTGTAWYFFADSHQCGIWDHKGIRWSYSGPKEIFVALFGAENVTDDG